MNKNAMVLGIALATACVAPAQAWETSNPFTGVTYSKLRDKDVHPILNWKYSSLAVNVMEIDLGAKGISFTGTPKCDPASIKDAEDETWKKSTGSFAKQTGTQIAMNTTFFALNFNPTNNLGLVYSDGKKVSPASDDPVIWAPAINISKDNQVEFINGKAPSQFGLYNAFAGSNLIAQNGIAFTDKQINNYTKHATTPNPRTGIGYNAKENKLIMMTVDGRQEGVSYGVTMSELGKLLVHFGADWAINLDGGGSTQMVMNKGNGVEYVNVPVGNGYHRPVGHNVGVYANIDDTFHEFSNFEHGNNGKFTLAPHYSGSNANISTTSTSEVVTDDAAVGQSSMKVTIKEKTASDSWMCRFLSGEGKMGMNTERKASGFIGVWAKTSDENQFISIAVDEYKKEKEKNKYEMEYANKKSLVADGEWHFYEWDIDDSDQWLAFTESSDGVISSSTFTLDSVLLYGDNNSVIYLDNIVHDSDESMSIPEPTTLVLMGIGGIAALRRRKKHS